MIVEEMAGRVIVKRNYVKGATVFLGVALLLILVICVHWYFLSRNFNDPFPNSWVLACLFALSAVGGLICAITSESWVFDSMTGLLTHSWTGIFPRFEREYGLSQVQVTPYLDKTHDEDGNVVTAHLVRITMRNGGALIDIGPLGVLEVARVSDAINRILSSELRTTVRPAP